MKSVSRVCETSIGKDTDIGMTERAQKPNLFAY